MTEEIEKDRSRTLWEDVVLPQYCMLSENLKTQVCVVGGGMSGISLSYQMAKRGFKVVLLEGSRLASGQSGRTTAHLSYQPEEQLSELIKHHNQETLTEFLEAHKRAIDVIEENIFQENISCDFKRIDGYLFLGPDDKLETLQEEVRIGREMGLDLTLVNQIPAFPNLGPAVVYPRQAQFHPKKYISALLRAMQGADVSIYENSHVIEFKTSGGKSRIVTEQGFEIEADHLIVATDTPVNNRFFIHTKQAAYRTYVVAFKMVKKLEIPLLWDTANPYHYVRQNGDTLIVGGADHRTGQSPYEDPYVKLEKWARMRFSFLGETQWHWSGQIFEPYDQLGFIGRNPGIEKNVYITTGESGMGMTSATIASVLIPDLIEGRDNQWEDVFDPSRINLRSSSEYIKENSNTALQYADWIKPAEARKLEEIPLDGGGVIREGLSKTCVYHNESDNFERKSAVCSHLGGIVHWNELEKTWDCPCHGSRYNTHGKVIEGPALNDLAEK